MSGSEFAGLKKQGKKPVAAATSSPQTSVTARPGEAARGLTSGPAAARAGDAALLQRTVGNRAVGKLLSAGQPAGSDVIRRSLDPKGLKKRQGPAQSGIREKMAELGQSGLVDSAVTKAAAVADEPATAEAAPVKKSSDDIIKETKGALLAALQSGDAQNNPLYLKWLTVAKGKWTDAGAKTLPSDDEFFSAWQSAATLLAKAGGALDQVAAVETVALTEQGSGLAGGAFWSSNSVRYAMGSAGYKQILEQTRDMANTFAPHFVDELKALRKGAKVAFWSGGGADSAARKNCDVALEKSTLARAFDWNTVSTWEKGSEVMVWAALSDRYATEIAKQWSPGRFEFHGFMAPGADVATIFNEIESKAVTKILGDDAASVLQGMRWHGVKKDGRNVDWESTSEGMEGCFISGTKKFVEYAVQGMRG